MWELVWAVGLGSNGVNINVCLYARQLQAHKVLGFVKPSCVWSGWQSDLTRIMLRDFLMGDLLRLSPWSGGPRPLWNWLWWLGFYVVVVFFLLEWKRKYCSRTLYSSLIIVKFLQFRERRQIAKPRKYCLVRVIVFLWSAFSLFFFISHKLGIWVNSLHI